MADKQPANPAPATAPPSKAPASEPLPSSSGGTKRQGSDLTEPADKKSKTISLKGREPDSGPMAEPPSGFLSIAASRFSGPFAVPGDLMVEVLTEDCAGYFASLWNALVTVIYPDGTFEPTGVISSDDFTLVCRYLMKSRIDHVYFSVSGMRDPGRIAMPREFEVPRSLAEVINGVGYIVVDGGAARYVPKPEPHPADAAARLSTKVSYNMLKTFSTLVAAAKRRGYIQTATLSSVPEGTGWWMLSARKAGDITTVASEENNVVPAGTFKEWTPADGLLCAIVQRKNDGLVAEYPAGIRWAMDFVTGVPALRRQFNLQA